MDINTAAILNRANEDTIVLAAAFHTSPVAIKRIIRSSLKGRFLSKVRVTTDGCWKWLGASNTGGYGSLKVNGRVLSAAQVAYRLKHGKAPKRLRHTCGNPGCVNPDHLSYPNSQI